MKEIQTNGITLLLVEVPEDASDFRIDYASIIVLSWATTNENGSIELSSGKWVILGKSTELSEEQMKEICEYKEIDSYDCDGMVWYDIYRNYALDDSYWLNSCDQFFTVQESYLSLLEANGIVDRNPYELPESGRDKLYDSSETHGRSQAYHEEWHKRMRQWQESQSKVKHYLVLKRI